MINFNQAISIIRRNGGFKPNRRDTSYYRTYTIEGNRPLQARVSNHGTWLWTWYDKDYDPSYAINFCVVFSENGAYDSDVSVDMTIKDERGNIIGQKKPFEVIQYVYNCQLLDINDATLINQQVQSIWRNKGFNDPFANTPKHAKVLKLKPNEPIEQIVENKQYNSNTNMNKKLIRLTESDLHRIIKESVNKVLNERIKWEKGMSDDELKHRRLKREYDDANQNYGKPIWQRYPEMPDESDINPYIDWEEKRDLDRLNKHRKQQNMSRNKY